MGLDVAPGAGPGIGVQGVPHGVGDPHQGIGFDMAGQPVEVQRNGFQQGRQVGGVPFAGHIALGETDAGRGQHPPQAPVVLDLERGLGPRLLAADHQPLA